MIVIDIGCARYGGDYSIERLIEEFHPDVLYAFDPNPVVEEGTYEEFSDPQLTKVIVERKAAWIFDGEIGYVDDGLNSWITDRTEEMRVKCFDLAHFITLKAVEHGQPGGRRKHGTLAEIVLKMDAEGSEYDLLSHLMIRGADELLKLAWVEWHVGPENATERRRVIEAEIACELAEWRW